MNLRQQVLSGTDQLRQQLLQAVDRLDNDFQTSPATNDQQHPPTTTTTVFVPATTQSVSRTVARSTVQPAVMRSTMPPYSQSPTLQPSASAAQQPASSYPRSLLPSATQQPSCSYTPMSQSSNLESLLQQQTSSLFCTDPRRRTFLWNPRSSIGMKRSQTSKRGGKKKKLPTWAHTFVCLSDTSQVEVPDGMSGRLGNFPA